MKKVVLYIRVSTLEQAQEGYSVGEQRERLLAFCKAHGWLVVDIYVDSGYTGSNLDRPGIQKLIADVNKFDVVLVYKLDRLSRSQKDTLYLIEEVFLPNGLDFVSMQESFDTATPFGRAMIGILSVFAQLEREQIKERTHMGRIARAKEGLYRGGGYSPIGYEYKDGRLVVNEYEAIQIRKIFEWYVEGLSAMKILQRLRKEGYTNRYSSWANGNASTSRISQIISNDVYIGTSNFDTVSVEDAHEAIISRELFETANKTRAKRHEIWGNTAYKSKYLLVGFIFCSRCGARYSVKHNYGDYKYYVCYSRAKTVKSMIKADDCDNDNWSMDALETRVTDEINKLLVDPAYFERLVEAHEKKLKKGFQLSDEVEILGAKIADLEKQISKLMDLYQADSIPADVLSTRIDKLYRDKVALNEQLDKILPQTPKKDFDAVGIADMLSDLSVVWEASEISDKKLIMETLIDRIILDGQNVNIEWSFLEY